MRFRLNIPVLALIGLILAASGQAAPREAPPPAIVATVGENELSTAITSRLPQVQEFRFIVEEARKLGVRAWLFGGTAAGFAHYVKWDLLRAHGDPRFQPDRFDYDYTNIYRSTQDLDIVVDGPAAKAQELQKILAAKYPHLQGSKTAWEVRPLREAMGPKEALLGNPDFLNQHTDSNSTGMIELTHAEPGQPRIRDLRDWGSRDPQFLRDVREGKLHYYFSPTHSSTSRAARGLNPPIFSAIRFLTKAFQYELEIRPEDYERVARIVRDFEPARDLAQPEAAYWIEKNGKKLIQHAVNIEYAVQILDQLGLREKLLNIRDNANVEDTLSWWMGKAPLETHPLGNRGRTAAELFAERDWPELVVAHETRSFLAYESITRAHTGEPNVLISRPDYKGEAAALGSGFYTRVGRKGARRTGWTIRFTLDPGAREGIDFRNEGDYVVILNKRAIRVIPESLQLGPAEFFRFLAEAGDVGQLEESDRGVMEKLKRRVETKYDHLAPAEEAEILQVMREVFQRERVPSDVVAYWLDSQLATRHLAFTAELLERAVREKRFNGAITYRWFFKEHSLEYPGPFRALVETDRKNDWLTAVLGSEQWGKYLVAHAGEEPLTAENLVRDLVSAKVGPPSQKDPFDWVRAFLESPKAFRPGEEERCAEIIASEINRGHVPVRLLKVWFELPVSRKFPTIWSDALSQMKGGDLEFLHGGPGWEAELERLPASHILAMLSRMPDGHDAEKMSLTQVEGYLRRRMPTADTWWAFNDFLEGELRKERRISVNLLRAWLNHPASHDSPELAELALSKVSAHVWDTATANYVTSHHPLHLSTHRMLVSERFYLSGDLEQQAQNLEFIRRDPNVSRNPKVVDHLAERILMFPDYNAGTPEGRLKVFRIFRDSILGDPEFKPELSRVRMAIERDPDLGDPASPVTELYRGMIRRMDASSEAKGALEAALGLPPGSDRLTFLRQRLPLDPGAEATVIHDGLSVLGPLFSHEASLLDRGKAVEALSPLSRWSPKARRQLDFASVQSLDTRNPHGLNYVERLLDLPVAAELPELAKALDGMDQVTLARIFRASMAPRDHWRRSPYFERWAARFTPGVHYPTPAAAGCGAKFARLAQ